MRASGRFRVTKICELQIHISSIPESGKGRGESDGGDTEPRILFPDTSPLAPCFPIQGKGFGNQGADSFIALSLQLQLRSH